MPLATNHKFCVAPMMGRTDKHFRYFLRLMSAHTLLYTEMVAAPALLRGNKHNMLSFNAAEHPVGLQIGGSNPKDMALCAKIAEDYGYDEVNINVGCPSKRVNSGQFGACLFTNPQLVAECVTAMLNEVNIPVTIKCRIGVDDYDEYIHLSNFVEVLGRAGCKSFIVHARKAVLKEGFNPKQNRNIPTLNYPYVYRLKHDFPQYEMTINGGIETIEQAKGHLKKVDGVMLGRAIYRNPFIVFSVDEDIFNDKTTATSKAEILNQYINYIQDQTSGGEKITYLTRHLAGGMLRGQKHAKLLRKTLHDEMRENKYPIAALRDILSAAI